MAMNNLWVTYALEVIKINVHGIIKDGFHPNGNMNSIGLIARNHSDKYLWDIMGPMKGLSGLEAQVWAIHFAMKQGVLRNHPDIHIETDNIHAFNLVKERDEEIIEVEGFTVAVQQINVLHAELNRVFEDESQPRSCRITSVFATTNSAHMYLAEYGTNH